MVESLNKRIEENADKMIQSLCEIVQILNPDSCISLQINSLFAARGFLITTIILGILQILMKTSKAVQKAFFIVQVPILTVVIIALVCMLVVFKIGRAHV